MNYLEVSKELISKKTFEDISLNDDNIDFYKRKQIEYRTVLLVTLLLSLIIAFFITFIDNVYIFLIGIIIISPLFYTAKKASDGLKMINAALKKYIENKNL